MKHGSLVREKEETSSLGYISYIYLYIYISHILQFKLVICIKHVTFGTLGGLKQSLATRNICDPL